MKSIINFQRTIAICLMFLLCYPIQAANDYTEAEMDSLAMKFYRWEKGNENDSIRHAQIREIKTSRVFESYTHNHEYAIETNANQQTYIEKILIIVKENIYSSIPSYILRYAHDIHNAYGCSVDIESVNGETAPQIRSLIQTYATGLNGTVLIGDIAHTYFYHPDLISGSNTLWVHETFPCDLFYMDLNGSWDLKSEESIIYDRHTGDVKPEVFVGRINTSTMGRAEIQELKYFFDKDHTYWTGKKALNKQRALTFTYKDWNYPTYTESIAPLYGDDYYDAVHDSALVTKANYCTYLENSNYEFIQLACHSFSEHHNFRTPSNPYLYASTICTLNTKQIGYNLFCCHACDWTYFPASPCLGESYLYGLNNNSSALSLVGSTKTGGMQGFDEFYNPLGNGKCIGQALKEWWINQWGNNHDNNAIHWAYGMVILGDPFIDFNFTNDCDDILYLNDGEEATNHMYYAQSKIFVQNYSLTQGQSVSLSAPSIQIAGTFVCNVGSTFIATPFDSCVCNTSRNSQSGSPNRLTIHPKITSDIVYSIYPNPVKDVLTIDINEQLKLVAIYNQSGQCILQTSDKQINVSHLSQGVYIIRAITIDGQILQSKIIHQ